MARRYAVTLLVRSSPFMTANDVEELFTRADGHHDIRVEAIKVEEAKTEEEIESWFKAQRRKGT